MKVLYTPSKALSVVGARLQGLIKPRVICLSFEIFVLLCKACGFDDSYICVDMWGPFVAISQLLGLGISG
jgi:hypothetical protein